MKIKLIDRWALVTGASSGIGESIARELAARGCHLFLVARRESRLRDLAAELSGKHRIQVRLAAMDLSVPGAADALLAAIEGLPVSVLVNNAGFAATGLFEAIPRPTVTSMIDLNVKFLTELTQRMLPALKAHPRGAAILNVGSIAGYQGVINMAAYAATKAYVNNLTEGLNWELRDTNVHATCLAPGKTASEFFEVAGMSGTGMARSGLMSSEAVARQAVMALEKGKPAIVTGWLNKLMVFSLRLSPRGMVRGVITRMFRDLA